MAPLSRKPSRKATVLLIHLLFPYGPRGLSERKSAIALNRHLRLHSPQRIDYFSYLGINIIIF